LPITTFETSMNFIGLDIHKKTISYCVKDISGKVLSEGKIPEARVRACRSLVLRFIAGTKNKSATKGTANTSTPARSERGTNILAFPLTLLIMDGRITGLSEKCSLPSGLSRLFSTSDQSPVHVSTGGGSGNARRPVIAS
jgi:hypothetical protein